jgi:hypothetical protein
MDGHTRALRLFIVAEWLVMAVSLVVAFVLAEPLAESVDDGEVGLWVDPVVVGLVALGAWLVGSVGAFRLWRPARMIYALAVALLVGASALSDPDPSLHSPVLDALDQLGSVASGVVLGLLFFSEARRHFTP